MAAVLLQSVQKVVTGVNGTTLAFGSDVATGSLLCATQAHHVNPSAAITTPTDTLGHTYVPMTAEQATAGSGASVIRLLSCYVSGAVAGADTVTFDIDGVDTGEISVVLAEFSGVDLTGALDQTSVGGPTLGASVTSGTTATTSQADELIVSAMTHDAVDMTITETGGATLLQEYEGGTADVPLAVSYQVVSSAGAYAATWTLGSDVGQLWVAHVATFKAGEVGLAEPAQVYPYKIPQAVG